MAVLAFSQARLRCDGPCQSRSRATSPPSRCPRPSQAEDAERCYSVVGRIDYIVGHEAFDITDDRNCTLLDPVRQPFGHASFCLALTDSRVHGFLLQRRPNHSITSSALACSVSGTVRPSALAVCRLLTSSNLVNWAAFVIQSTTETQSRYDICSGRTRFSMTPTPSISQHTRSPGCRNRCGFMK